jgi:hypothetical protein
MSGSTEAKPQVAGVPEHRLGRQKNLERELLEEMLEILRAQEERHRAEAKRKLDATIRAIKGNTARHRIGDEPVERAIERMVAERDATSPGEDSVREMFNILRSKLDALQTKPDSSPPAPGSLQ